MRGLRNAITRTKGDSAVVAQQVDGNSHKGSISKVQRKSSVAHIQNRKRLLHRVSNNRAGYLANICEFSWPVVENVRAEIFVRESLLISIVVQISCNLQRNNVIFDEYSIMRINTLFYACITQLGHESVTMYHGWRE